MAPTALPHRDLGMQTATSCHLTPADWQRALWEWGAWPGMWPGDMVLFKSKLSCQSAPKSLNIRIIRIPDKKLTVSKLHRTAL